MKIGARDVEEEVFVIAEIGMNHEGDFVRALEMVDAAASSGVSAVKFQTIVPERLVAKSEEARLRALRRVAFSLDQYARLAQECERRGVLFLSTPFDLESLAFLAPLMPAVKIASGDNDFLPLIRAAVRTGKPVLLSTGIIEGGELRGILSDMRKTAEEASVPFQAALLHCVSSYPTPDDGANLLRIRDLEKAGLPVGYSDHTLGIEACVAAVALGARIIEKHFTLDKNQSDWPDHKLSAEPEEMVEMIRRIRRVEAFLRRPPERLASEREVARAARRSIAAARDLKKGEPITESAITWLRPGTGIPVGQEERVLGRRVRREISSGSLIREEDLE
ncbi:MAG: hypothetical protein D6679_05250 [Candidatus Hydrogenedentota bacterium]|nr:MAG: hypothetical protein D6679_05250 [Candidatus Hydrogenedentota bacterium]